MRIVLACAAYPPQGKGGGPAASESIARALHAQGHDVRVITVADEETHEVRDGIDIRTLRSPNVYWDYWKENPLYKKVAWHLLENGNPRALVRMRHAISAAKPDIVMTISCENINVATWLAARTLGIPTVHAVQSYFLLCWRGSMFRDGVNCPRQCRSCRYASTGKRLHSHLVDGVIAESRHMLDRHAEAGYFAKAKQKVIPAATDWPIKEAPRPLRDTIKVGYIGVVTPNKGVETLARAAARLGEQAPLRYLIAGSGPSSYAEHVHTIFPNGRCQSLGWVDPKAFYPEIDVLVVPSLWGEPFGRVCIEAFSHGVAVIAARSGALPEIVEDGKNGLTYPAGDAEALAECLNRIERDRSLLAELQRGALKRTRDYSPERLGSSLETFLADILRERTGQAQPARAT
ncbi:glycosyltransferase family 4 protein [Hyphomicrobium sp. CS1GBMeth3]|uniref:glycosyltransferase family 4 protein n=1 Tax=Hyphomicrobium sp. CS1GBMeth3 TaxID=1892845 RepID=UPI000931916C|nr:glycosyltransferase family 4 protein [Hyphomicrobium sp. CS1GBMeth3]